MTIWKFESKNSQEDYHMVWDGTTKPPKLKRSIMKKEKVLEEICIFFFECQIFAKKYRFWPLPFSQAFWLLLHLIKKEKKERFFYYFNGDFFRKFRTKLRDISIPCVRIGQNLDLVVLPLSILNFCLLPLFFLFFSAFLLDWLPSALHILSGCRAKLDVINYGC